MESFAHRQPSSSRSGAKNGGKGGEGGEKEERREIEEKKGRGEKIEIEIEGE